MNYEITHTPTLTDSECLVLGLFSNEKLSAPAQSIDEKHQQIISKLAKKANEKGDLFWQTDVDGKSLLLIQCGNKEEFTPFQLKKRLADVLDALFKQRIQSVTLCLPQLPKHSADWQLEQMILQVDNQSYQMLEFKKKHAKPHALQQIKFYLPHARSETLLVAQAIAQGVTLTRHLANLPANICTPTYLGEQAQQLAQQFSPNMQCQVMGLQEIQQMKMNALLAVAQGSAQDPRFIELQYQGASKDSLPIVLVGKGITFDSGGLSIKPANAMEEMKYDMCGAASVLGVLKACALLKLPINVIGLIASAENMLSGTSVKSGDIVTSLSGQTIEIINTDAEGRLVLADALTYAERFNPRFVIDIATLTGAVIVALGTVASGYMTNDNELAQWLEDAAKHSNDRIWRLPLDEEYQDAIDSPLADMINAGFDRTASSVTAACFLSRFTEKYRWLHLDIAGTAWIFGKKRNATGRPVPLLTQLIRHVSTR